VKLFDCWFRDGRAKGAPQMRTGKSEKSTISAADMAAAVDDELPPLIMPHLEYSQSSLDLFYPSLSVAGAVDADDHSTTRRIHYYLKVNVARRLWWTLARNKAGGGSWWNLRS